MQDNKDEVQDDRMMRTTTTMTTNAMSMTLTMTTTLTTPTTTRDKEVVVVMNEVIKVLVCSNDLLSNNYETN